MTQQNAVATALKSRLRLAATHLLYLSIVLLFLFPLYWALVSSLRPNDAIFADLIPFNWRALVPWPFSFEAYQGVFSNGFGRIISNTLLVSLVTMVLGLIVNALAGFAFAVFQFRGKNLLLAFCIISFMLPFEAIAMPLYAVTNQLGWIDHVIALIIPAVANGLAIFLFHQFFKQVPKDYVEAAFLDGAGWWRILWNVYLPLSIPTCISAGLLLFIFQWESFLWPLLALPSQEFKVIQVGMASFQEQHTTVWNQLFAISVITAFIPVLLLMPLQKYYAQGLAGSGIKG